MDFKEMKVIWDSQNDEPLYAINQEGLRRTIRQKARNFKRYVLLFEVIMTSVALLMAGMYIKDPLLQGEHPHRLASGFMLFGAFVYFSLSIFRRMRREQSFDSSLFGDLEKAIWQVDYHISRTIGLRLGFIIPMMLAFVLDAVFLYTARPIWMYVCAFSVMGAAYWAIDREVRCMYHPQKRKLEALREKLVEVPQSTLPGQSDTVMA